MKNRRLPELIVLGLVLGWLVLSCSTERNFRTLSFFFDGVPDPNAPPAETPTSATQRTGPLTAEEKASMLSKRVEVATVYFHEPVRKRECNKCHTFEERAGGAGSASWLAGTPELVLPIEQLCGKCHEPHPGKNVHGPVDARRCDICHTAHQSPFPHLLRFAASRDVCQLCHQGAVFVSRELHATFVTDDCTACHNPHASELDWLLRPDWESRAEETVRSPTETEDTSG